MKTEFRRCEVCNKTFDIIFDNSNVITINGIERDFCSGKCACDFISRVWEITDKMTDSKHRRDAKEAVKE